MIELHIPNTTVQTGVAPISWCVGRQTLEELASRGVSDPEVLIIIAPEENYHSAREVRKIVPLKELMTYIEFRSPGPNRVFAVVFGSSERELKDTFLRKFNGDWGTHVLSHDGNAVHGDIAVRYGSRFFTASEPLRVDVPQECFAAAPFDADWVNLMFSGRPENQCDFRRRRLFAYSIQPILSIIVYLFRLLAVLIFLLLGRRGIDYSPLTEPLTYETEDIWRNLHGSFVVPRGNNPLRFACLAFSPIIVLAMLGMALLKQGSIGPALLTASVAIVGLAAAIIVILFALNGLGAYLERKAEAMYARRSLAEGEVPWYLRDADELVCAPGRGPRTGAGDVPRHLRTMRLRFEDLKSRVCRPFAR